MTGPLPGGDVWNITMHSSSASGAIQSIHGAWATLCGGIFSGHYGSLTTVDIKANSLTTDALDPVTGKNTAQVSSAVTLAGTLASGILPTTRTAIVIGFRTALPTRAGRGRLYLPPPAASVLTVQGQLTEADTQLLATQFAGLLDTFTATATPVILHRGNQKVSPPVAPSATNIVAITVGEVLGSQRRRTNKVPNPYSYAAL